MHLKPRIIDALQKSHVNASIEEVKYIGFGEEDHEDVCQYFEDVIIMKEKWQILIFFYIEYGYHGLSLLYKKYLQILMVW